MEYLLEVPVQGGESLLFQVEPEDLPLAGPGELVTRARQSLETALGRLKPSLAALSEQLKDIAPDEFSVELGLSFGVESGLFVAKGKGDAHLTVTMTWKRSAG